MLGYIAHITRRDERTKVETIDLTHSDLRGTWRISDGAHLVDGQPERGALVITVELPGVEKRELVFAPGDALTQQFLGFVDGTVAADEAVTEKPLPEPEPEPEPVEEEIKGGELGAQPSKR